MQKNITRKEFLRITSAVGAGLLLPSFGSSAKNPLPADNATSTEPPLQLAQRNDPRYDQLRKGYNTRIDKRPLAIAPCRSTSDVAQAILYAKRNNLAVAVRSGGHSMEGFSGNDDGLVIHLASMNHVDLRADGSVRIGPGATLSRIYDELLPKQRIIPAGSCGTVGIGGLTLGGGYGFFSRKHGLTCDSLLSATMVDGNGVIRTTDDDPELLWALRGGGAGNFGVVTELVFKSHPAPATFQSHRLKARKLTAGRAKNILAEWFEIGKQLPTACFSAYVLNGRTLTILVTNYETHTEIVQKLLDRLATVCDEYTQGQPSDLAGMLKRYYGSLEPLPFKNASAGFYRDFRDIAGFIEPILDKCIAARGLIYQINTLGGNIADPKFSNGSSYAHREFNFISELQAYWQQPEQQAPLTKIFREIQQEFEHQGIAAQYVNYCSLDFKDWQSAYYGKNYARLQAVKKRYDPADVIRHPQSIKA